MAADAKDLSALRETTSKAFHLFVDQQQQRGSLTTGVGSR